MARSFHLPYQAKNPRTVRGAKKRNWYVISPNPNYIERTSWLGLNIWCERSAAGYWVASFSLREFAFEKGSDALAFQMKWG